MKKQRVMWLLNHTTLRNFEIDMLNSMGVDEVFTPKSFPYDEGNLSASVTYIHDSNLSIPKSELAVLNDQDWYQNPSQEAWDIANKYFNIVFIAFFPQQLISTINNFNGQIVLRAFGLGESISYTQLFEQFLPPLVHLKLKNIRNRFWFGSAYTHLKELEGNLLQTRNCFLPVGLKSNLNVEHWNGSVKKIMFVCPRINTSPYYKAIYEKFKLNFKGLPHIISGAQPIEVKDETVLGYIPKDEHERNMQEARVMFYHSTEPYHIHYHPFEAIKAGMPLVFMAEGMLDRMGGKNLPGRCKNMKEARKKIEQILNDDWSLIENIRSSQLCMLDPLKPENCIEAWRNGLKSIFKQLENTQSTLQGIINKPKRIAVILPVKYKGGSLRGAMLLAQAIEKGAHQAGEKVEVIFCHLDDFYTDEDFVDLPPSIKRRPFNWFILDSGTAQRAMIFAGSAEYLKLTRYQVVDDQISQLMDCDLLIVVSDRLEHPLLPLKPYINVIYDYIQRYEHFLPHDLNRKFIDAAHHSKYVWVTTEFTRNDAIQFAGLPSDKVIKLPMLAPQFTIQQEVLENNYECPYFLWTTNAALHKNHVNAFTALSLYYEKYNGKLECHVTGVNTKTLANSNLPHLKPLAEIVEHSPRLKQNLKLLGELSELAYQSHLKYSQFLWHAGRIDNGTFSVIEAAHLGVPALSSDYPAMREINEQFSLNLSWMNAYNPHDMAIQLKKMEVEGKALKTKIPSPEALSSQSLENLSSVYWKAVKKCL